MSLTGLPLAPIAAVSVTVTGALYQPKLFGARSTFAVVVGGEFTGIGASPGVTIGGAGRPRSPICPPVNLRLDQSSKPFSGFGWPVPTAVTCTSSLLFFVWQMR